MFICINTHFICYVSNAGLSTPHYPVFPQLEEKKKMFFNRDNFLKTIKYWNNNLFFKNTIINTRYQSYDRTQSGIIKIKFMLTEK